MVAMDSASSVPPHIPPPMAQVPMATGDTLSDVLGISVRSVFILRAFALRIMILFFPCMRAPWGCGWRTSPSSIGCDRVHGVESCFLLGDEPKGGPVEF